MIPIRKRRYIFKRRSRLPRLAAIVAALLAGAAVVFFLPRPSATVTARMTGAGTDRALVIEVDASGGAERFDVPQLALTRPLAEGRTEIRVPAAELTGEGNKLAYVVRGPWYSADQEGEIAFERPATDVHYVATVKPDGAGGAWLTIKGERGNHILLFDPAGKVAVSGQLSDLAGDDGAVRVRFSAPDMNAAQREDGPTTARLSVTGPTGEVSDHEIVLREAPVATVSAVLLFPPPGTTTDHGVVRVRLLTEPGATVRFGDAAAGLSGPRVEYDWPIPRAGMHTLTYEVRSPGLRSARGTIEVERLGKEGAKPAGEGGGAPASLTLGALMRDTQKLTGKNTELAGEILARPAPMGSLELFEIGPGGGGTGEVAVVFAPEAAPPLRGGDRVIVRGRVEGTQRLRTAAGRVKEVPKVRAEEVLIPSQAASTAVFESRYAILVESFWRDDTAAAAPGLAPPTARVLASTDPWPEAPPAQPRRPVLASEVTSGLGDHLPPELLALPAPPAGEEEGAGGVPGAGGETDRVEGAARTGTTGPPEGGTPPGQAPATAEVAPEAGGGPKTGPPPGTEAPAAPVRKTEAPPVRKPAPAREPEAAPVPTVRVDRIPGTEAPGLTGVPPIGDVPVDVSPPAGDEQTPPEWAWTRDRALESELGGRGVTDVRVLRRGRSIRLRGTVPDDAQLRTLYQFMNDKGFGEVDYGVEVR